MTNVTSTSKRRKKSHSIEKPPIDSNTSGEIQVGDRLREIRLKLRLSLRELAKQSGLNVNTLSLIENGRTSPSVSTLQQLGQSLQVPITAFFETDHGEKKAVFRRTAIAHTLHLPTD